MTITAEVTENTYTGTGANTALATTFTFEDDSDVVVIQTVTATAVETTMVDGTNYNITGGAGTTGTVTPIDGATDFTTAMTWKLKRVTPRNQTRNYQEAGEFPAESHEDALDKLTRIIQELETATSYILSDSTTDNPSQDQTRFVRAPAADGTIDMILPAIADRKGKLLQFHSTTGVSQAVTAAEITADIVTFTAFFLTLVTVNDGDEFLSLVGGMQDPFTTLGDMVYRGASDPTRLPIGSSGQVLTISGGLPTWAGSSNAITWSANKLYNSDFRVWLNKQIIGPGVGSPTDGMMLANRWKVFHEDATWNDLLRSIDGYGADDPRAKHGLEWEIVADNDKRAIGQILPYADTSAIVEEGTVSVGIRAKIESGAEWTSGLTLGILEYTDPTFPAQVDVIPADWVSAWNADTAAISWATNFSLLGSTSMSTISTSYQLFTLENVTVPSTVTNLAIVVFLNDMSTHTLTRMLFLRNAIMVPGSACPTLVHDIPISEDTARCEYFFRKTFPINVEPGDAKGNSGALHAITTSNEVYVAPGQSGLLFEWRFPQMHYKASGPTVTFYNPSNTNSDKIENLNTGGSAGAFAANNIQASTTSIQIVSDEDNDGHSDICVLHATVDAEL